MQNTTNHVAAKPKYILKKIVEKKISIPVLLFFSSFFIISHILPTTGIKQLTLRQQSKEKNKGSED